jgi:hypothetical protein
VTCYTHPCKPCNITCIVYYLPQGDESSPRGGGICAPALPEVLTTYGRTVHFFCMGLGLVAAKTMSEALAFRPQSVLGYAIDNNLLGAHGWSRVQILAQKTTDDKILEKIRRRGTDGKDPKNENET